MATVGIPFKKKSLEWVGNADLYVMGNPNRKSLPRNSRGFEPLEAFFPDKTREESESDSDSGTEELIQKRYQQLLAEKRQQQARQRAREEILAKQKEEALVREKEKALAKEREVLAAKNKALQEKTIPIDTQHTETQVFEGAPIDHSANAEPPSPPTTSDNTNLPPTEQVERSITKRTPKELKDEAVIPLTEQAVTVEGHTGKTHSSISSEYYYSPDNSAIKAPSATKSNRLQPSSSSETDSNTRVAAPLNTKTSKNRRKKSSLLMRRSKSLKASIHQEPSPEWDEPTDKVGSAVFNPPINSTMNTGQPITNMKQQKRSKSSKKKEISSIRPVHEFAQLNTDSESDTEHDRTLQLLLDGAKSRLHSLAAKMGSARSPKSNNKQSANARQEETSSDSGAELVTKKSRTTARKSLVTNKTVTKESTTTKRSSRKSLAAKILDGDESTQETELEPTTRKSQARKSVAGSGKPLATKLAAVDKQSKSYKLESNDQIGDKAPPAKVLEHDEDSDDSIVLELPPKQSDDKPVPMESGKKSDDDGRGSKRDSIKKRGSRRSTTKLQPKGDESTGESGREPLMKKSRKSLTATTRHTPQTKSKSTEAPSLTQPDLSPLFETGSPPMPDESSALGDDTAEQLPPIENDQKKFLSIRKVSIALTKTTSPQDKELPAKQSTRLKTISKTSENISLPNRRRFLRSSAVSECKNASDSLSTSSPSNISRRKRKSKSAQEEVEDGHQTDSTHHYMSDYESNTVSSHSIPKSDNQVESISPDASVLPRLPKKRKRTSQKLLPTKRRKVSTKTSVSAQAKDSDSDFEVTCSPGGREYRRMKIGAGHIKTPGVRRSQRTRVPPARPWLNEKIEYNMRRKSGVSVKGLLVPMYHVDEPAIPRRKQTRRSGSQDQPTPTDSDFEKLTIGDSSTEEDWTVVRTIGSCQVDPGESEDFTHYRLFTSRLVGYGVLCFKPLAIKETATIKDYQIVFHMLYGQLDFSVNHQVYHVTTGMTVHIPPNSVYKIENLHRAKAQLFYFTSQVKP